MAGSNWGDYRVRKWTFWVVLSLGLVATLAMAELVLIERYGWRGLAAPALAWLALTCVAGWRWQRFRCPRCEHRFFRSSPPLLAMRARRCVHCMLTKD